MNGDRAESEGGKSIFSNGVYTRCSLTLEMLRLWSKYNFPLKQICHVLQPNRLRSNEKQNQIKRRIYFYFRIGLMETAASWMLRKRRTRFTLTMATRIMDMEQLGKLMNRF